MAVRTPASTTTSRAAQRVGPVAETTEALAEALRTLDVDVAAARADAFARASFDVADGHATERVVEQLLIPALDRQLRPREDA